MDKVFGMPTGRVEDRDLLRGDARFVADIRLPNMLHAAFVRSPYGHARILSINSEAALALPGVTAVLTAHDIKRLATTNRLVVALPDKTYRQQRDRFVLAEQETVHVGEAIAMVIATDAYVAEDAAGLVEVAYEPLAAVNDCRAALAEDSPTVHCDGSHNLAAAFVSSYGDINAAFARAAHVVDDCFWTHRGVAHSMECRGCVATYNSLEDKLTLWSSTQTPLVAAQLLADLFDRDDSSVRVVAPDVGGGFGPKLVFYPEEAAVAAAALQLSQPVRWIEDRREHCVQLAKALGARVLAGVSTEAKAPAARAAGADDFIDLSKSNLRDALREEVFAKNFGRGVDVVIDPIGGDAFDAALRALAWRGRLVVVGFASGRIPEVKANYLLVKNIEVTGLQVSDYRKRMPDMMAKCLNQIFALFEAGQIRPPPFHTVPLDAFATSLQKVVDRRAEDRIILEPNP